MIETQLNYYFNKGKFNHPTEIGYVMDGIRKCAPVTLNEWRNYYFENIRDESFLEDLANRMYNSIETQKHINVSEEECLNYIHDVIFRRTFEGYNKENMALKVLNEILNDKVELSPKEWDGEYFIDFVIRNPLIGIQLKPESFYQGRYYLFVNIDQKLKKFEQDFNAKTYILIYSGSKESGIEIINIETIEQIRNEI